ncbi:MAG: 15,16-dihydrobiliverdin:ferredoxin oxidoreductase [Aphanocapsa feldmannii 277cV]|uniref:15,16-dihydrobiliverdin:ferredoxin oxidoreductase n=1 Tax=Aphanocapsa feldmannii 277cV TaxID=2507553 RepID=A0A524RLN0_9CHRO|nr:MAG: 15,16-dihydrobiliverdin:ferredoxin oxidoreductase [Aphanocapsa feldmannii 288cV]TGG90971.1 MAG: 15,16-dihydrobiliverdin:ferredoxin oxidoreductase [Aphanocapsa feldmannii 277cV]
MFEAFLERLAADVAARGGTALTLPQGLDAADSSRKQGRIRSQAWQLPGIARLRATRLDAGAAVQVLNAVAYPDHDREQPLLGIDLLSFGTRDKLVAVMDFQPLKQEPAYLEHYLAPLRRLQGSYPAFAAGEEMRSYDANRYFSPWLLFARGTISTLQDPLAAAFGQLLDAYWAMHDAQIPNPALRAEVAALQLDYDIYSAEKDPAHGLFCSYFGKEWADRFVHEFLFPGSATPVAVAANKGAGR